MGWSRQRPARRAVERDDEAIARWVAEDWPRVKKGALLTDPWVEISNTRTFFTATTA